MPIPGPIPRGLASEPQQAGERRSTAAAVDIKSMRTARSADHRDAKAQPPDARNLVAEGGDQNGLDGVHAVLCLLEGNAGFALEHVFGHFNAIG